ncbi:P-loop containing nucleoside triphosphate hydrolase protein [Mycena haematopus]|nr:P-loop containing nucleoside triphosphate hydrolase protein [Mycena haematopus]
MDFIVPQAVMALVVLPDGSHRVPFIPTCITAFSASILLFHFILALKPIHRLLTRMGIVGEQTEKIDCPGIGTGAILCFRVARLLGCIGLLALWTLPPRSINRDAVLLTTPYLYASALALFSVSPRHTRHRLVRHANCVLLSVLCVYAYRDLIPLTTFTGVPEDIGDGWRLWAKIGLLFITAVIIPLFTPRQYVPVDPLNPQATPNREQTASIFSFAFYSFLDPIIFLSYRESQLQESQLYPLCDSDASAYLKSTSFEYLDRFSGCESQRHIFFGLLRIFALEFTVLAGLMTMRVFANFSGPLAMNRLLQYIETQDSGVDGVVRPWVWIVMLLLGPTIGSLVQQFYMFIITRCLVRLEAIITQLIFTHSLRIRMKSETVPVKDTDSDVPVIERPESAASARSDTDATIMSTNASASDNDSATANASSSSVTSTPIKPPPPKPAAEEPTTSSGSLVGRVNNLVTVDLDNIGYSKHFLMLVVFIPLQLIVGIWFLYALLGWSVGVGVVSMLLLAPVPGYMAQRIQSVQKELLKHTDERVQAVSETVDVFRMVKLFGWENKMQARIEDKRDAELTWLRKRRMLHLAMGLVNFLIPIVTLTLTYGTYVCIFVNFDNLFADPHEDFDHETTSQRLQGFFQHDCVRSPEANFFLPTTLFPILTALQSQYFRSIFTYLLNDVIPGKVSLDRVNDFLKKTEILDAFDEKTTPVPSASPPADERIGFRNATFSWSKESDGSPTRSHRQFQLKIPGEVLFRRGRINLVVGPTSSGKTSLLMALLGEMHFIPSSPDSWYNLPRSSGVAYAAQESWVLNDTIRSNIVFNTPFDEERYKKVLYQCALEPDLALFQARDETEVGEKGLTLSGGQKARLTLARAVYSEATILLLDDVLAALDVHTAQWIVEKCFGGDLIENRTVILVTHNIALARPIADFVVSFGSDGRLHSQGTISEATKRGSLAAQIRKDQRVLQQGIDAEAPVGESVDGKLIVAEEVQLGHVGASAWKMYLLSMAGKYPFFFFSFFFGILFFQHSLEALRTWQLGYWAKQYDERPAKDIDAVFYLSIFVAIVFTSVVSSAIAFIYITFGQLRASKVIHVNLIGSVLHAPLRWLDVTPTSRIIARVTKDVRAVDDSLAYQIYPLAFLVVSMTVKFVAVLIYVPIFFFPGAVVGTLGAWVGQIYISGQLPAKRLMSNNRAPVLAHFSAAIAGLVSIRAFGAEARFNTESLARIDRYTRAARNYYNLNRWVAVRIDFLGAVFSAGLATYLVYLKHTSAGDSGFLLNMAITFTGLLLSVVRVTNEVEVQGTSLERIQAYIDIEHENPNTEEGKPPAYWPASGDLRVEGLSARYSEDGPEILHNLTFHIKSGERIGIVGRTGSGKSSLTLSLLRCIPTEGSMKYDGLETSALNLDALRSSITIIPQVPELLSGSLRANLDPFSQCDDTELNDALRAAGLFALQTDMEEGRISLDSVISSGGTNLSVGQRQILALARAIVRKSKILILDEATSAIDYKTDSIIQNSLRQALRGDVSLITVAHRLQTIMDADKIMVLDAGRIVEYDSPKELLQIKNGKLRALVDDSGDSRNLYAMAGGGER